jgi:hypothetical protein
MKIKKLVLVMLSVSVLFQIGCSCDTVTKSFGGDPDEACEDHWHWKEKAKVVQAEPAPPEPAFIPCAAPRMVRSSQGYPASGPAGGAISIEKLVPDQVVINEPFDYRLKVTNLTDRELLNVVVTDVKPAHMKLLESDPEIQMEEGQMEWHLGPLGPKASKTISVRATALQTETILTCADVTYEFPICAKIDIVEPKLLLTKQAPKESLRCDRIPILYTITNTGSGYACDISITDKFAEGMVTSQGKGEVAFNLDTLGPGEKKEFRVMVDAAKSGKFASRAMASARTGGKATSEIIETVSTEPVLAIDYTGPTQRYLGRSATYNLKVSNTGDAVAKDTIVEVMIPENAKFDHATSGGVFTHSSPGKVMWNLGTLKPNESRDLSMTVTGQNVGKVMTRASAKAYCAEAVAESAQTTFAGIPGILLEVVDVSDPIEQGQNEMYIITVTNQGSADDTQIKIDCVLEDSMQYISSSGPTTASVVGKEISFAPLASLAPKEQAKWMVNVKATGTGDVRFKTIMKTAQLDRTVEETEATRFYE